MSEENGTGLKLLEFDNQENGILAYSVDRGKISDEAAALIWERFDDAKKRGTKLRLYAEMLAIPKFSGTLVLDKLKRLGTIFTTVEKMAIVGDAGWMDVYAKIVDPLTKFDIKHFTLDQQEQAKTWVSE